MEININQKKIAIGDKYIIFVDGQQVYKASRKLLRWLPEIVLFTNDSDKARIIINKQFSFFKAHYYITRHDNSRFEFNTVSYWKRHYQCQTGADSYDIYGHRGRKYSVYKNDKQVAWWDKNAVTWFAGDNYKIIADTKIDRELVISFCLVIDNFSSEGKNGNAVTFNVGNIGPQAKAFDKTWQPEY